MQFYNHDYVYDWFPCIIRNFNENIVITKGFENNVHLLDINDL